MNAENSPQPHFDPRDITKNKVKSIIAYTARVLAMLSASGTLMQTFLAALGFGSNLIYIHSSFLQTANVFTIILFSDWASHGNTVKRSAYSILPNAILFLIYVPIAIQKSSSAAIYGLLTSVGISQQISIGLFTVCEYKIPYYIYRKDEYGTVLSVCGIVSSLFSLGSSLLISYCTSRFSFTDIMAVVFFASAFLIAIAFVSIYFERSLIGESPYPAQPPKKQPPAHKRLLKSRAFTCLIPANLMRGFTAGFIGVLAAVALDLGYTENLTALMVPVHSIASLGACLAFSLTAKKISPRILLALGSCVILLLPMMLIPNTSIFLAVFFVITAGKTLIDYAVPALLILVVDVEIAGPYHAWRMMLQNAGALIATVLASAVPIPYMLVLAALSQLFSGISFIRNTVPSKRAFPSA